MGYECIVCMETLETPAPEAAVAVPQYFQEADRPGPSRKQKIKRAAEDTPEYRSNICSTACGHIFHRSCLNRWFHQKMKKECPSCRKLLTPGKIFHIYPPCLSEDFLSHKTSELMQIENHLPRCGCGTEDCGQLYTIHKTLANDHSKLLDLLRRFTDQADDKSLLLARIASLEEECERLKRVVPSEKSRRPDENSPQAYQRARPSSLMFNNSDFRDLFSASPPSPSASSSTTSDSEAGPTDNLFSSIITALMTPSQLSRLCTNELIPLNSHRLRPQVTTTSTGTTTTRNLESLLFSSSEIAANEAAQQQYAATVTNAIRFNIPDSYTGRNQNSNINSESPRNSSRINRVPSNNPFLPTPAPSATLTNGTFTHLRPRISINLLNLSGASTSSTALNNSERSPENTPRASSANPVRQKPTGKLKQLALKSTSRPMKQIALKSTSRPPPSDKYSWAALQSLNRPSSSSEGKRNNIPMSSPNETYSWPALQSLNRPSSSSGLPQGKRNNIPMSTNPGPSNLVKIKLVAKKSTSKPARSAVPSTSYPVHSTSYYVPTTSYPVHSTSYPAPTTSYHVHTTLYPGPTTSYPVPTTSYSDPSTSNSARHSTDAKTTFRKRAPYNAMKIPRQRKEFARKSTSKPPPVRNTYSARTMPSADFYNSYSSESEEEDQERKKHKTY